VWPLDSFYRADDRTVAKMANARLMSVIRLVIWFSECETV